MEDPWDWIVWAVASTPTEHKQILHTCTPYEIAKCYAMQTYYDSYEIET